MRKRLHAWIKKKHRGLMIRRTANPYLDHLIFVAERAGKVIPLGYEIGICHDLLEETHVTSEKLLNKMMSFGYMEAQAHHIVTCVVELTDVFTKKSFPDLPKRERKRREAARLTDISADAQTVKYADLIYNINWTVMYDKDNAADYLYRKQQLIRLMNMGDEGLRTEALSLISRYI
ncbi:hypothetical protein LJ707_02770 [Mucilaginibacter sp. UR6-1]|uniref:hypothetical protein n=1 Tax=Mucilaginibacter sp. UR6-1 TaxID=1435643 RepID=UPI001E4A47F3|nr:hypothetical protein [Mucilaginibacter sp. UR6-1]MCC8407835.1 hypothetical protein [Mucilaginibacter sp. UR6-1]